MSALTLPFRRERISLLLLLRCKGNGRVCVDPANNQLLNSNSELCCIHSVHAKNVTIPSTFMMKGQWVIIKSIKQAQIRLNFTLFIGIVTWETRLLFSVQQLTFILKTLNRLGCHCYLLLTIHLSVSFFSIWIFWLK